MRKSIKCESIMLSADSFDENVERFFYGTDVMLADVFDADGEMLRYKQIKRIHDNSDVEITRKYNIVQHREFLIPFLRKFILNNEYKIHLFKENIGKKNRMICRIQSGNIMINGENYKKILLLSNSSDMGASQRFMVGIMRMACLNMSFVGAPFVVGKIKHISTNKLDVKNHENICEIVATEFEDKADKIISLMKSLPLIPYSKNFLAQKLIEELVSKMILPKELIRNPISFFEKRRIIVPRSDFKNIVTPETMFDIYNTITLYTSNMLNSNIANFMSKSETITTRFIKFAESQGYSFI